MKTEIITINSKKVCKKTFYIEDMLLNPPTNSYLRFIAGRLGASWFVNKNIPAFVVYWNTREY